MPALTQFRFDGHDVRTVTLDGEPWFVLNDLTGVLGIGNARMVAARLDEDMKGVSLIDTLGGKQKMTIVSEAGMYDVIVRSDSPMATPFRRWITTQVLPSIRRTGSYGAPQSLTGPELMAAALIEAQATLAAKDKEIRVLAPKANRYETFLAADGDWSMRDAAQVLSRDHGIKIGQNNLARWMRDNGWLDRRGIPYQDRINAGHLRSKPRTYKHPRTGEEMVAEPQVRITPRGLDLLAERLGGKRLVEVPT